MGIPVVLYALYQLGKPFVRLLVWFTLAVLYKYKISGKENSHVWRSRRRRQPFIVAGWPNHAGTGSPDPPHDCLGREFLWKFMERFANFCGVILMGSNPKAIRRGLTEARQVLKEGEVLGIFPEGGISRDAQVKGFKPGLQLILKKADPVPIVPVYFDEIWGSNLSYVGGKAFNRLPLPLRRPLSIHIGKPLPHDSSTFDIRQSVQELSARTMENYAGKFIAPVAAFGLRQ